MYHHQDPPWVSREWCMVWSTYRTNDGKPLNAVAFAMPSYMKCTCLTNPGRVIQFLLFKVYVKCQYWFKTTTLLLLLHGKFWRQNSPKILIAFFSSERHLHDERHPATNLCREGARPFLTFAMNCLFVCGFFSFLFWVPSSNSWLIATPLFPHTKYIAQREREHCFN